jgi:hypothetical protein
MPERYPIQSILITGTDDKKAIIMTDNIAYIEDTTDPESFGCILFLKTQETWKIKESLVAVNDMLNT